MKRKTKNICPNSINLNYIPIVYLLFLFIFHVKDFSFLTSSVMVNVVIYSTSSSSQLLPLSFHQLNLIQSVIYLGSNPPHSLNFYFGPTFYHPQFFISILFQSLFFSYLSSFLFSLFFFK